MRSCRLLCLLLAVTLVSGWPSPLPRETASHEDEQRVAKPDTAEQEIQEALKSGVAPGGGGGTCNGGGGGPGEDDLIGGGDTSIRRGDGEESPSGGAGGDISGTTDGEGSGAGEDSDSAEDSDSKEDSDSAEDSDSKEDSDSEEDSESEEDSDSAEDSGSEEDSFGEEGSGVDGETSGLSEGTVPDIYDILPPRCPPCRGKVTTRARRGTCVCELPEPVAQARAAAKAP